MSLSDCEKCWTTPCFCGHEYKNYTNEKKIDLAAAVLGVPNIILSALLKINLPKTHPINKED